MMIKHRQLSIFLSVVLLSLPMMSVAEERCVKLQDTFPCHLEIISWVNVNFQGDLLTKHKSEFERLIRLRLRNDLSVISHERREWADFLKENEYDFNKPQVKTRGSVYCLVWTVGEDYPVAIYVECALSGWGNYGMSTFGKFESRALGYAHASKAREWVDESIRGVIADISGQFLEARDVVRKLGEKKIQNP